METPKVKAQRRHERISHTVPATVKVGEHTLAGTTKDISVGGLFLFTDVPFRAGSDIEVVLMLPKELGLEKSQMVCCHGRIVRVETSAGQCGIAAEIERIANMPQM
ncbi:MAG: PilZ domain-containing protein [Terriglobales bacterium]